MSLPDTKDAEQWLDVWIDKTFDFARERQYLIDIGRLIEIKTPFGILSTIKHPLFSEENDVKPT